MSGEMHPMETRRRSRSKTPFLRSACDHEDCEYAGEEGHLHHHKKKTSTIPSVQTIIEETVVSSSSTPLGKQSKSKTQQAGIKTSDYSSEELTPEEKAKRFSAITTTKTTTTTTETKVVTKNKRSGGLFANLGLSSTPKRNEYLQENLSAEFTSGSQKSGGARQMESAQNEINTAFERSQRQISNKSANRSWSLFGSDQSTNGDISNHIAYQEYKKAGEYWKTTPKTDYTYSEFSPYRRVLAPGIVAMPNMSRRSLENHHERVDFMVSRDPAQEEYIRRRYQSSYTQNRNAENLMYDSGDELDYGTNRRRQQGHELSWLMRIVTTILTTVTSAWSTVTGGADSYQNEKRYRTYYGEQERGFFGSIAHGISGLFFNIFRYIYLFTSSVLCLDTILLKSNNADNKNKKRFLIFLLILLPLLLLAGIYYYLHPNDTFPPKHFSEYTFTLPELPKIDMTDYLNQAQYDAVKAQTLERLEYVRDWADDYWLYLKTITQNVADEGRKFFQRETHYDRV